MTFHRRAVAKLRGTRRKGKRKAGADCRGDGLIIQESPASTAPATANIEPKPVHASAAAEKIAATDSEETEYATAYVPLPYSYDPSAMEGGTVVRVVLPRAALVSYGLPIEGMGVSDQVTADMVVSEDGTPQAIRLVTQANPKSDD